MADRCFRRCWGCDRYEPHSGCGSGGYKLFSLSSSGCYEAHDLPWERGHWCPFWGNKHHPDGEILRSLTWDNVKMGCRKTSFEREPKVRQLILDANPEIAKRVEYCDNSNESREQYFNKSENWTLITLDSGVQIYCETLKRYRFSLVDNRALYPGYNEWLRPMMVCYDPKTYRVLELYLYDTDGVQISFACSPDRNYHLNPDMFQYNQESKEIICEFLNGDKVVETHTMSIESYV